MDTTFSQSVIDECADRVGLIFRSHIVARVEGRTLEQQWEEAIELLNTQLDFMRAVITPGVIIPRFLIALDLQLSQRRGRWPAWRAIIDGDVQGNTDHPWMEYQAKTPPTSPTTSSPQTPEGRVSAPSPSRISLAPPTVVPAGNKKTLAADQDASEGKAEATQPRPDKGKGKAVAVQDVAETAKPQLKVDKGKGKATAVQDVAKNAKPQPKVDKGKAKAATVAERSDSSQSKVLARTSSKPKEDKGKGKKKQGAEKVPEKQKKKPQTEPEDSEEETRGRSRVRGSPTVEDNRAKSRRGGSRRSPSVPAVPAPSTSNKRRKASKVRSSPVGTSRSIPAPPSPPAPLPTSTDEPCERCAKRNTACQHVEGRACQQCNRSKVSCSLYRKRRRSQSRPPPTNSGPHSQPSTSPRPVARAAGGTSTESSQQQDVADGKEARQSPPPKRAKRNAPKGFPVGPPKRTAVVVQTGARRKQVLDAVVITTHKKGRPHVIPTAQSSSGTPAPSTPSSAVQEPDVPVTREEFNRLQEQLQQLKMLHIGVGQRVQSLGEDVQAQSEAMQTFGRILDILRQGEVGQGSTSASAQLRYPFEAGNTTSAPFTTFQAANATSAPSTPPRSAENALGPSSPTPRAGIATTMGSLHAQSRWLVLSSPPPRRNAAPDRASTPSQARPSPWLSPMQVSATPPFEPPREATPPAEELPVPGLQTGVDTGDEETDSREASASGMQGLLDYLGDSEDDNMDVVTAEAKEHEV
ncbi:hypothetical protein L210DRAFT_3648877 [Boletus edulis BED1]|uniref:Zn(2)-C6 fungal-type domain-containing protein n=1 Tax=Boletus edulis BED1 TaxID=1328754 RepID=A0AAD4BLY9_BOLED|nr:hypothetical protein L210DRAFT_3648877 [Boletus edulis BED1]